VRDPKAPSRDRQLNPDRRKRRTPTGNASNLIIGVLRQRIRPLQNQGMRKPRRHQRNLRLEALAADLADLERATVETRINTAIEDARRRTAGWVPTGLLKPYQADFALELIGDGQSVPIIAGKLHCGPATLYRAIATTDIRRCCSR
jgi:hypothetical protein